MRPNASIEGAHVKNTDTGSIVFSIDGRTLLTRGGDDTVKRKLCDLNEHHLIEIFDAVWDVRAFKKSLATHVGLTSLYPQTNAIFSPDEKHILVGSGATVKGHGGKLVFLKRDTFEVVKEIKMESTVVKVVWHSKINQVCESRHLI